MQIMYINCDYDRIDQSLETSAVSCNFKFI